MSCSHRRVFSRERDLWIDQAARCINIDDLSPLEVDDEFITEDGVLGQPVGKLSAMTGFVAEKKILICLTSMGIQPFVQRFAAVTATERDSDAAGWCECGRAIISTPTAEVLWNRLHKLRYLLDDLPSPLSVTAKSKNNSEWENSSDSVFSIQRANLLVTCYWAQNYIIECLLQLLLDQQKEGLTVGRLDHLSLWQRREDLCHGLLDGLMGLPLQDLQRNGAVLVSALAAWDSCAEFKPRQVYKVRQIAASLLDCPETDDLFVPIFRRSQRYIKDFSVLLADLEQIPQNPLQAVPFPSATWLPY